MVLLVKAIRVASPLSRNARGDVQYYRISSVKRLEVGGKVVQGGVIHRTVVSLQFETSVVSERKRSDCVALLEVASSTSLLRYFVDNVAVARVSEHVYTSR